ncbi:XdhC family protein [Arthrobacter sp. zg-ZUI100]|nr:XdhC family protein [Arthrobacter jiangjiafuii]
MLEILDALASAMEGGLPCAAATVVRATGSIPRPVGTSMLISGNGTITGSLSGGCVEAAVVAVAEDALADGRPRLESFGYSDTDAFAAGLTCGGTLDVMIQPFSPVMLPDLPAAGTPCALLTRMDGPMSAPLLVSDPAAAAATPAELLSRHGAGLRALLDADPLPAAARLAPLIAAGRTGQVDLGGPECGGAVLFLESRLAAPRLVLVGSNDFSDALARQGRLLGYHVTVCDARPAFTTPDRFPAAHQVTVQWPDQYLRQQDQSGALDGRSVICVLTHDARFDVAVLAAALQLNVAYVGAMGSRRSHETRMAALAAAGVTPLQLQRLHSPIGLDIGAASPEETALSVFAEIVAARSGAAASRLPLRDGTGPIHPFNRLHVS